MNGIRDRNGFPQLWIIVDKRGEVWANRSSARSIINRLKKRMTKEVWDTWKFRVVGYQRLPQYAPARKTWKS